MILLTAISISFASSGPNMKEGLWEITVKTEMPGMEMPPMKHTQCLNKKELCSAGALNNQGRSAKLPM